MINKLQLLNSKLQMDNAGFTTKVVKHKGIPNDNKIPNKGVVINLGKNGNSIDKILKNFNVTNKFYFFSDL